ncbi:hypothetical protein OG413_26855 [Streptomyces sp. NBC_01433]|uniref:hypothetical protein n=1 Tax=Streptomyces sp. NBC_01433 TaxID=2903864 RepID=UPI0022520277|nr:hypothetical protein [Streptomyces sp. NBC_01433]MCX4678885.1 hypothetical protein [Streptomyces sp. NBC_01433]
MSIEITDTGGRAALVELTRGVAGGPARVGIRIASPAGGADWSCTPATARALAAALVRAAEETEDAQSARPVTVKAHELLRGDVRDTDRAMTVVSVKAVGSTVQVTWTSGAGRSWTQGYAPDTEIALRRRLRPETR